MKKRGKAKILVMKCICETSSPKNKKIKKGEFCMSKVQYRYHFTCSNFQNVLSKPSSTDILV